MEIRSSVRRRAQVTAAYATGGNIFDPGSRVRHTNDEFVPMLQMTGCVKYIRPTSPLRRPIRPRGPAAARRQRPPPSSGLAADPIEGARGQSHPVSPPPADGQPVRPRKLPPRAQPTMSGGHAKTPGHPKRWGHSGLTGTLVAHKNSVPNACTPLSVTASGSGSCAMVVHRLPMLAVSSEERLIATSRKLGWIFTHCVKPAFPLAVA
jgi:hypothetical protein